MIVQEKAFQAPAIQQQARQQAYHQYQDYQNHVDTKNRQRHLKRYYAEQKKKKLIPSDKAVNKKIQTYEQLLKKAYKNADSVEGTYSGVRTAVAAIDDGEIDIILEEGQKKEFDEYRTMSQKSQLSEIIDGALQHNYNNPAQQKIQTDSKISQEVLNINYRDSMDGLPPDQLTRTKSSHLSAYNRVASRISQGDIDTKHLRSNYLKKQTYDQEDQDVIQVLLTAALINQNKNSNQEKEKQRPQTQGQEREKIKDRDRHGAYSIAMRGKKFDRLKTVPNSKNIVTSQSEERMSENNSKMKMMETAGRQFKITKNVTNLLSQQLYKNSKTYHQSAAIQLKQMRQDVMKAKKNLSQQTDQQTGSQMKQTQLIKIENFGKTLQNKQSPQKVNKNIQNSKRRDSTCQDYHSNESPTFQDGRDLQISSRFNSTYNEFGRDRHPNIFVDEEIKTECIDQMTPLGGDQPQYLKDLNANRGGGRNSRNGSQVDTGKQMSKSRLMKFAGNSFAFRDKNKYAQLSKITPEHTRNRKMDTYLQKCDLSLEIQNQHTLLIPNTEKRMFEQDNNNPSKTVPHKQLGFHTDQQQMQISPNMQKFKKNMKNFSPIVPASPISNKNSQKTPKNNDKTQLKNEIFKVNTIIKQNLENQDISQVIDGNFQLTSQDKAAQELQAKIKILSGQNQFIEHLIQGDPAVLLDQQTAQIISQLQHQQNNLEQAINNPLNVTGETQIPNLDSKDRSQINNNDQIVTMLDKNHAVRTGNFNSLQNSSNENTMEQQQLLEDSQGLVVNTYDSQMKPNMSKGGGTDHESTFANYVNEATQQNKQNNLSNTYVVHQEDEAPSDNLSGIRQQPKFTSNKTHEAEINVQFRVNSIFKNAQQPQSKYMNICSQKMSEFQKQYSKNNQATLNNMFNIQSYPNESTMYQPMKYKNQFAGSWLKQNPDDKYKQQYVLKQNRTIEIPKQQIIGPKSRNIQYIQNQKQYIQNIVVGKQFTGKYITRHMPKGYKGSIGSYDKPEIKRKLSQNQMQSIQQVNSNGSFGKEIDQVPPRAKTSDGYNKRVRAKRNSNDPILSANLMGAQQLNGNYEICTLPQNSENYSNSYGKSQQQPVTRIKLRDVLKDEKSIDHTGLASLNVSALSDKEEPQIDEKHPIISGQTHIDFKKNTLKLKESQKNGDSDSPHATTPQGEIHTIRQRELQLEIQQSLEKQRVELINLTKINQETRANEEVTIPTKSVNASYKGGGDGYSDGQSSINFSVAINRQQMNHAKSKQFDRNSSETHDIAKSSQVNNNQCQTIEAPPFVNIFRQLIQHNSLEFNNNQTLDDEQEQILEKVESNNNINSKNKISKTFFAIRKQRMKQRRLNHSQFQDQSVLGNMDKNYNTLMVGQKGKNIKDFDRFFINQNIQYNNKQNQEEYKSEEFKSIKEIENLIKEQSTGRNKNEEIQTMHNESKEYDSNEQVATNEQVANEIINKSKNNQNMFQIQLTQNTPSNQVSSSNRQKKKEVFPSYRRISMPDQSVQHSDMRQLNNRPRQIKNPSLPQSIGAVKNFRGARTNSMVTPETSGPNCGMRRLNTQTSTSMDETENRFYNKSKYRHKQIKRQMLKNLQKMFIHVKQAKQFDYMDKFPNYKYNQDLESLASSPKHQKNRSQLKQYPQKQESIPVVEISSPTNYGDGRHMVLINTAEGKSKAESMSSRNSGTNSRKEVIGPISPAISPILLQPKQEESAVTSAQNQASPSINKVKRVTINGQVSTINKSSSKKRIGSVMTSLDTFGGGNPWQVNDYSMDSPRNLEPHTASELKKGSFQLGANDLVKSREISDPNNDSFEYQGCPQPRNLEIKTSLPNNKQKGGLQFNAKVNVKDKNQQFIIVPTPKQFDKPIEVNGTMTHLGQPSLEFDSQNQESSQSQVPK